MRKTTFNRPHPAHKLHSHHFDPHSILVAVLSIVGPIVFLYVVWRLTQLAMADLWTLIPAPLAWGG